MPTKLFCCSVAMLYGVVELMRQWLRDQKLDPGILRDLRSPRTVLGAQPIISKRKSKSTERPSDDNVSLPSAA